MRVRFREEAEDDEGTKEAAPPCSVRVVDGCRRFPMAQARTPPCVQARQWEETDADQPASKYTPPHLHSFNGTFIG